MRPMIIEYQSIYYVLYDPMDNEKKAYKIINIKSYHAGPGDLNCRLIRVSS